MAGQYAHSVYITINSPTDYSITGVDSEYRGAIEIPTETTPHGPEFTAPVAVDKWDESVTLEDFYVLARQPDYGANAQIPDHIFISAISFIENGDYLYASHANNLGFVAAGVPPLQEDVIVRYNEASFFLENCGYKDTPLYELTLYLQEYGPSVADQIRAVQKHEFWG